MLPFSQRFEKRDTHVCRTGPAVFVLICENPEFSSIPFFFKRSAHSVNGSAEILAPVRTSYPIQVHEIHLTAETRNIFSAVDDIGNHLTAMGRSE